MGFTAVTPPQGRPVELADVKAYLRIDGEDSDELLLGLVEAATARLDGPNGILGRALLTQTWDWTLDAFPASSRCALELPLAPVQSVTSVTYVDGDGDSQTWSSALWQLDATGLVARLLPAYGQVWPSPRRQAAAVTVRFVAGYAAAAGQVPGHAVPAPIRQAIVWLVAHWYEHREPVALGATPAALPEHLDRILDPFKIVRFA